MTGATDDGGPIRWLTAWDAALAEARATRR